MRRSSRLVSCVGLASGMFALSALAAPPVMDHVPGNAMAVITIPSIANLHKNATAFAKAVEAPIPIPELGDLVEQLGIPANKAFDPAKASVAIAFVAPPAPPAPAPGAVADLDVDDEEGAEQMMIFILPVTSYADFVADLEVKAGPAGAIDSGAIGGSEMFFKDLGGGFVAMAPVKDTLVRAQWNEGDAAAHRTALGKGGDALVESSDLSWTVYSQQAKQFLPELKKAFEEQMEGNPAGGAIGEFKNSPLGQFITGPLINDSTSSVTGFRIDAQGIAIDTALSFKADSDIAKKLGGITGSSSQLLSKLPAQPYLIAMAADLSSPGARKLVDEVVAMGGEQPNGVAGFLSSSLKNSDGAAMVIGMPPGGLMTGLFTSTIAYVRTTNPERSSRTCRRAGAAQRQGRQRPRARDLVRRRGLGDRGRQG